MSNKQQELDNDIEAKHNELLSLLNPLAEFMNKNGFNYFLVAGKDGKCARYAAGRREDISGMISGLIKSNKEVADIIGDAVNHSQKK